MAQARVLILRSAGTNCDLEAEHAWRLAGADTQRVHIGRLIENPAMLREFQVITIPGGFSYGDDIAAGAILAAQISRSLKSALSEFVSSGGLVLGICNGFQVLVKAGLLPDASASGPRECTITYNDPPGFQDRWIAIRAETDRCPFLETGRVYEMPIAHGEGRVAFESGGARDRLLAAGHAALVYAAKPGEVGNFGESNNPNGSVADIAGLTDTTGRVLGLMPHPERFVDWVQHPCWTALPAREQGDGLSLFTRAVKYLR